MEQQGATSGESADLLYDMSSFEGLATKEKWDADVTHSKIKIAADAVEAWQHLWG